MNDQKTEIERLERENATRAHQVVYSYLEKGNEAAIVSGQAAVKNLFLMHGGALIAMLTFTSGIINNSAARMSADSLVAPMVWFSFGLALATAASAGTYLTNYCHIAHAHKQSLSWSFPYVVSTRSSRIWGHLANFLHVLTIIIALGSLTLFVVGFLSVKTAFTSIDPAVLSTPESGG